jgi:hypothetical protein
MPQAVEIFDDLTPTVQPTKLIYTVRKPPYVAGTVSVFRNGMLQDPTFFTELDPAAGTVELAEPILLRDQEDHNLTIAYCTFEAPFVDPEAPRHISQLRPGDVVRIAMKAGRHLDPVVRPKTKQVELLPAPSSRGRRTSCRRNTGASAKNFSRTVFFGFITQNDPVSGQLRCQTEHRSRTQRDHVNALVPYKDIRTIRVYVTPSKPDITPVVVSGARNAVRRPGALGRGTEAHKGFLNLVRVFF